jgi:beta-lactam-binding protein with PASTA domain
MGYEDAKAAIEAAGLVPNVEYVYTEDWISGTVLGTNPEANTEVKGGSTVAIKLARSRGEELENEVSSMLYPGAEIEIGGEEFEIQSVESIDYAGNNTVEYTLTARPFITRRGETAYFSAMRLSGTVEFDDAGHVIAIS